MSKTQKIIIVILILMLLLGIAITIFMIAGSKQQIEDNINNLSVEMVVEENNNEIDIEDEIALPSTKEVVVKKSTKNKMTEDEKENAFLKKTASAFVERYGSYSNQSNYENLRDLLYFMTNDFRYDTEQKINTSGYIKKDVYYGVTTYVVDSEIKFKNLDETLLELKTQRQEFYADEQNDKVIYKTALVNFKKEGGVWKVDEVNWQ